MVQVEFIERDSIVTTDAVITQPHPPWGLARLSSRTGNDTEYRYHESAGEGTCVYILGTGVDGGHPVSLSSPLPFSCPLHGMSVGGLLTNSTGCCD